MSSPPRITAVILTWNAEAHIVPCVTTLARSRGVAVDLVVVDNASTDRTLDRVRASGVPVTILTSETNLGYAAGNNRGIAQALAGDAPFVFVVNDDTEVGPETLAHLLDALVQDPRAAAAAPTILHEHPAGVIWWAGATFSVARALAPHEAYGRPWRPVPAGGPPEAPRTVTSLCGCALLLRRDALQALGGFRDDFFMYVEDTELSLRYHRAGWRLLHVPSAVMTHKVAFPEGAPSPAKIRLRDRNRRRLVRAHYDWRDRLRFSVWFYPTRLLHLVRYLASGDPARARAIWAGLTEA
ncbi:MAG: hypothetical protein RL139_844 [Gemmatimonadota bacterium]